MNLSRRQILKTAAAALVAQTWEWTERDTAVGDDGDAAGSAGGGVDAGGFNDILAQLTALMPDGTQAVVASANWYLSTMPASGWTGRSQ